MSKRNKNTEVEMTTNLVPQVVEVQMPEMVVAKSADDLTTAELNQALKAQKLWVRGCQFLSNEQKFKLLTTKSDKTRRQIYNGLVKKMEDIKKAMHDAERTYKHVFSEEGTKNGVNVVGDITQLQQFMTPVHEDKVYFTNGSDMVPAPRHRAILNEQGKIITVVKDSYKLVRNEDIIMPLLEHLDKLDNKWYVDPSHSFINDKKMRIQLTFPDLMFKDNESDIAMSLFIHNSYDGSEGIKGLWGAIRGICSNGMVFGKVFAKFYAKHTSGFNIDRLKEQIEDSFKLIPSINERVQLMNQREFKQTPDFSQQVANTLGTRALAYLNQENGEEKNQIQTMWQLYNVFTYFISHYVNYRTRAAYQQRLASLMEM